jgi:hypothetical protein
MAEVWESSGRCIRSIRFDSEQFLNPVVRVLDVSYSQTPQSWVGRYEKTSRIVCFQLQSVRSACPTTAEGGQLTFVDSSERLEVCEHQSLLAEYTLLLPPTRRSAYRSRKEDGSKGPVRPRKQNTALAVLGLLISFEPFFSRQLTDPQ